MVIGRLNRDYPGPKGGPIFDWPDNLTTTPSRRSNRRPLIAARHPGLSCSPSGQCGAVKEPTAGRGGCLGVCRSEVVIPPRAVPCWQGSGVRQRHLNKERDHPMKKVPVVKITTPDAVRELAGLPLQATVAMADVAAAMREGLLAFSTAAGLVVMQQMLTKELASIVGPKHARLPDRVGNFHGTTTGQVVLGSQKVSVAR